MTYQVLARKWRPATLQDMVGQAHACETLTQALQSDRLHHAYLFTGTRGVGKTSIARIFAKCLNCAQGITPTPCGECAPCKAIETGRFVDLIEVDAASRTRVEETRELLDNVPYAPVEGRIKIYLIDEVHMLSAHSFNALLKTLEEPPAHVKFLLATTEPDKLPVTILSRCLQFHLRCVSVAQLTSHMDNILKAESLDFEPEALAAIARSADGSVRDALSLLEQAIAYGHERVTLKAVQTMLGTTGQAAIVELIEKLIDKQSAQMLEQVATMAADGVVFETVLESLLGILHAICLAQVAPESLAERYEAPEAIMALSKRLSPQMAQLYYQMILVGRGDFALALDPVSGFEMLLLRMMAFDRVPEVPVASVTLPPVTQTQQKPAIQRAPVAKPAPVAQAVPPVQAPVAQASPLTQATPAKVGSDKWDQIAPQLALTGLNRVLVNNCMLKSWENGTVQLLLDRAQSACLNDERHEAIKSALEGYTGDSIKLHIDAGEAKVASPAGKAKAVEEAKQTHAEQSATEDKKLQALVEAFDATIEKVSAVDKE